MKKLPAVLLILVTLTLLAWLGAERLVSDPTGGINPSGRGAAADEGQIYNVKAYGATGNGRSDDTAALSSAINECNKNGGVVFLPPGKYNSTRPLPVITSAECSIRGSGTNASTIQTATSFGSLLTINTAPHLNHPPYYTGPFFEHFGVICNTRSSYGKNAFNIGIHLIDTTMTKFFDVSVANCAAGFEEEDSTAINERNEFIEVNAYCNSDSWLLQQDPSDTTLNSFYHQTWIGNYVTTCGQANANVFHFTGGAQMMMSYIQFNGNIYGPSSTLFELDDGSAMIDTTLDVLPESGSLPNKTYLFGESGRGQSGFRNLCQSNLACVKVTGHFLGPLSNFYTKGNQWSLFRLNDALSAPNYLGTLTTTANTSDSFVNSAIEGHTNTTSCFFVPTNSIAAAMSVGTYVGAIDYQRVDIHHPPKAGGTFQIWCN